MTLRELCEEGRTVLTEAGVSDAKFDARTLLLEAFGITINQYIFFSESDLREAFPDLRFSLNVPVERYRENIAKRAARIPLQQITGEATFMGLGFTVNEHTLAPRPDTETLTEAVLFDHRGENVRILDLCTGTGCVGISLHVCGDFRDVTLSDISEEALRVARANAARLAADGNVRVVKSNLFEAFSGEHFDLVTANPPYIRDDVIGTLEPEVRDHEPRIALSGGEDGLSFYRRIIAEASRYTDALYFEIGYDQAEDVTALLSEAGWKKIRVRKDLGGRDRVVSAVYH